MHTQVSKGAQLIEVERIRQVESEGYSIEHDTYYEKSELLGAALAYLYQAEKAANNITFLDNPPSNWPWPEKYWKPSVDPIANLVKAGALIAAEIDRLLYVQQAKID